MISLGKFICIHTHIVLCSSVQRILKLQITYTQDPDSKFVQKLLLKVKETLTTKLVFGKNMLDTSDPNGGAVTVPDFKIIVVHVDLNYSNK